MPAHYDPAPAIAGASAKHNVHAVFSTIEPIDPAKATAYTGPARPFPTAARWRATAACTRTGRGSPPAANTGSSKRRGQRLPVFETRHGKVGLAMCSEVYMPEVVRALALRGAELIFMPAALNKRRLWETWRTFLWAPAIENPAIVVSTQPRESRPRHRHLPRSDPL